MVNRIKQVLAVTGAVAASVFLGVASPLTTLAAPVNTSPAAKVSFTFDDGYGSTLEYAAPALQSHGYTGTAYLTTDYIGQEGYLSWTEAHTLKDTYGWEVGAHSHTHPLLTEVSETEVEAEMAQNKQTLQANGFNPTSFAAPYGDYNDKVIAASARHFSSFRGFHDIGYNQWPYNDNLVRVQQVQGGVSVATVKSYIDQAIADSAWLVLVFHDIMPSPSPDPEDYEYSPNNLNSIAAYAKSKNIANTNVTDALVASDTNLLPNGNFSAGLANWATDTPTRVTPNSANQGSTPGAAQSVKLAAGTTNTHLFSAKVPVTSANDYMIKSYVHVAALSGGELGFYIDEYDAAGNWVSGQWKASLGAVEAVTVNVPYAPTSAAVKQASLQVYLTANSGITAYVDNVALFTLHGEAPPPPPPPANLVANGTFDAGIASGWATDAAANITADATSNGSPANAANSAKFTGNASNIHLFSPRVGVSSAQTYNLSSYLKVTQINSGEVGFYIDEYDAAGNWVSGQWKAQRSSISTGDVSFTYTPSSANVATASLQVYATANSGVSAYLDHVVWLPL